MKYALVTGASRGIGRAIALQLAQRDLAIIVHYNSNRDAAQEVYNAITNNGGKAELMQFNLADEQAIRNTISAWQNNHKDDYIDVLVNNAGLCDDALLVFMESEQWHRVVDTTLTGFFTLSQILVQPMLLHRHGRIINMTSISGIYGTAGQFNYSAAKAAIIGATKALAKEVAKRKVTVNAVAPGFITTDMTAQLDEKALAKTIPAERFGKPEEVAALVDFLVSEQAGYITGEVIKVAGGL